MKLLGKEQVGNRVYKYWKHIGDDGRDKLTVETSERVDPIFDAVKYASQTQTSKSFFRYKASIPGTLIEDIAKINAKLWDVTVRDAFSELVAARTDRAKRVMKMLTEGRDYSKLQAKSY